MLEYHQNDVCQDALQQVATKCEHATALFFNEPHRYRVAKSTEAGKMIESNERTQLHTMLVAALMILYQTMIQN